MHYVAVTLVAPEREVGEGKDDWVIRVFEVERQHVIIDIATA